MLKLNKIRTIMLLLGLSQLIFLLKPQAQTWLNYTPLDEYGVKIVNPGMLAVSNIPGINYQILELKRGCYLVENNCMYPIGIPVSPSGSTKSFIEFYTGNTKCIKLLSCTSSLTCGAKPANTQRWDGNTYTIVGLDTKTTNYSSIYMGNNCSFYCLPGYAWNGTVCNNITQNGLCGASSGQSFTSAPTINLCNAGIESSVTENTRTYTWTCQGIGTGTNMNCSATRVYPVNGVCDGTRNHSANNASFPSDPTLCNTGSISTKTTNATNYSWYCNGLNGGVNSPLCEACRTGYSWDGSSCVGIENGVCNGTTNHSANNASFPLDPTLCTVGTITLKTTNINNYTWYCNGIAGGSNSPLCEACSAGYAWDGSSCTTSAPGVCGPANGGSYIGEPTNPQLCTTASSITKTYGVWNSLAENATANWTCNGINGGANTPCSALRVYYPRYQCQFTGALGILVWQPVAGTRSTADSNASQYYEDDFAYASTATIGTYSCTCPVGEILDNVLGCIPPSSPTTGQCGASAGVATSSFPVINLCNQGTYGALDNVGGDGAYDWYCNGINGGGNVTCTANKKILGQPCTGLPVNAGWNTVGNIDQTWNGSAWLPTTVGSHNLSSSITECRYVCNANYTWNGSDCIADTQIQTGSCAGLLANSEWNTVSQISQSRTRLGASWSARSPTTVGTYDTSPSTTVCRYKCSTGNIWSGGACVAGSCLGSIPLNAAGNQTSTSAIVSWTHNTTPGVCTFACNVNYNWSGAISQCVAATQTGACTGLPANASWNTASSILQTWNGSIWLPTTVGVKDTSPSTTECRFNCNATWTGATCNLKIVAGICNAATTTAVWGSAPSSQATLCTTGTANPITANTNATTYNWNCDGLNGGSNTPCAANRTPTCGSASGVNTSIYPLANHCGIGSKTDVDITGVGNTYDWQCTNGSTVNCSAPKIINGVCNSTTTTTPAGSAPSGQSTLCAAGTANPITATTNPNTYNWNCDGINTGTPIACSTNRIMSGSCTGLPPSNGFWNTATAINQTWNGSIWSPTTVGSYNITPSTTTCIFNCDAGYSYSAGNCVAGSCLGSISGNAVGNQTSTSAIVSWHYSLTPGVCTFECNGGYVWSGGGCQQIINGVCNGTTTSTSQSSAPSGQATLCSTPGLPSGVATNTNDYTWTCGGTNGGSPSGTCTAYKTPTCNNSAALACTVGSFKAGTDNGQTSCGTTRQWLCTNAGFDSSTCSLANAACPTCGTAAGVQTIGYPSSGRCGVSTSRTNDDTTATSDYIFNWTCINGGYSIGCTAPRREAGGCNLTTTSTSYSSAPSGQSTLCATPGTASAVTTNTNDYTWSCPGTNGGSNAACTAYKTPTCNNAVINSCGVGTSQAPIVAGSCGGNATWYCGNGGYTSAQCSKANPSCAYSGFTCAYILSSPTRLAIGVTGSTQTPTGTFAASAVIYTTPPPSAGYICDPTINGQCGAASGVIIAIPPTLNRCTDASTPTVTTNATNYTWTCFGSNGGTNASCSAPRRRDGSCGAGDGQSKSFPFGTTNLQVQTAFYNSGLCIYSSTTRTASDVSLSLPNATRSCLPLNGGSTDNCAGTYTIAQATCAPNVQVSPTFSTQNYTSITITGGLVWTSAKIYEPGSDKYCNGVYTCPALGGTPTFNEVCTNICGGSNTCLAGYSRTALSGATYTCNYGYKCTNGGHVGYCPVSCGAGLYRNGSSCVNDTSACSATDNVCLKGTSIGATNNTCGTERSCEFKDCSNNSVSVSCGNTKCGGTQYRNGSSCQNINCAVESPYSPLSFSIGFNSSHITYTSNKTTTCTVGCSGTCSDGSAGTPSEPSCNTVCNAGYTGVDCACTLSCGGSTLTNTDRVFANFPWEMSKVYDSSHNFYGYSPPSCSSARTYYSVEWYGGEYGSPFGYNVYDGDPTRRQYSCTSVSNGRNWNYYDQGSDATYGQRLMGGALDWLEGYYYIPESPPYIPPTSYDFSLPACNSGTPNKIYYYVNWSNRWFQASCQTTSSYSYSTSLVGIKAQKECWEYPYSSCPAGCSVNTTCLCPPSQYSTSTGLCLDKIFNLPIDAKFAISYACIGTAGVYPSCPAGYYEINRVNTDSWGQGECSVFRWKDPKHVLCRKYIFGNRKVGESCLKTITSNACWPSTCLGLGWRAGGGDTVSDVAGLNTYYPWRGSEIMGTVQPDGTCN